MLTLNTRGVDFNCRTMRPFALAHLVKHKDSDLPFGRVNALALVKWLPLLLRLTPCDLRRNCSVFEESSYCILAYQYCRTVDFGVNFKSKLRASRKYKNIQTHSPLRKRS